MGNSKDPSHNDFKSVRRPVLTSFGSFRHEGVIWANRAKYQNVFRIHFYYWLTHQVELNLLNSLANDEFRVQPPLCILSRFWFSKNRPILVHKWLFSSRYIGHIKLLIGPFLANFLMKNPTKNRTKKLTNFYIVILARIVTFTWNMNSMDNVWAQKITNYE